MGYLFAATGMLFAAAYGVWLIRAVERRKPWALDLVRTLSLIHGDPVLLRPVPPRLIVKSKPSTPLPDQLVA